MKTQTESALFIVKIFKNDRKQTYAGRVGGEQPQQSNLMQVATDLNAFFASQGLNYYARVLEVLQ